jgi:hypothetical protein
VWTPTDGVAVILRAALKIVSSVPYEVSLRWVFYRLLQLGYYSGKGDYDKWKNITIPARKTCWEGWDQDTLVDETRQAIERGGGHESVGDWLRSVSSNGIACHLAHWYSQSAYCELWYEARAMTTQFEHYTERITLRPMAGDASIPYKSQAAHALHAARERYDKPVAVLYFGDLDKRGADIANAIAEDVHSWCKSPFEFIRCGLTLDQAQGYNVPENPDKPGEFQWEALDDVGAEEIITSNVAKYVDRNVVSTTG